MKKDNKQLDEKYILKHWEQDFDKDKYFAQLKNGDNVGYDHASEQFSVNNYWDERTYEEVESLVNKWGLDD